MKSEKGTLIKVCFFVEVLNQNFVLFYRFCPADLRHTLKNIIIGYVCLLKHFLHPTIHVCGAIYVRNLVVFMWER